MNSDRTRKAAHIRQLLDTEGTTIKRNVKASNRRRYDIFDQLGAETHEELRTRARAIKERSISQLPALIDELTEAVEANGGHVYVATDAADANEYIASVCTDANAETVVKSKSMTTEEIEVNDHLKAAGMDVYETDLGELVIQVAGEKPSHLIGPGFHKSRAEIAKLFNAVFEPDPPLETAEELTNFARDYLAERIDEADVGMTGANFIVAESGSIALITNEGNARKTVEATDIQITVGGVEKIIPQLVDLEPFIELVARSGSGIPITSYTSVFTPPIASPPTEDGPREFHLVLIDNGRMEMREDPVLKETLYCVRCSACLNSCANFQHVGGHAFGGETYTGGIATGWEAGIYGLDSAAEFNDLCTGCTRCVNQCPVKIDIPWINTAVRDRVNRGENVPLEPIYEGLSPDAEENGPGLQKRLFGNFETLSKWGSATAPFSNRFANTRITRALMDRFAGVDARRELPQFKRETLRKWDAKRSIELPTDPVRKAVLYPDIYTNYIDVDRGKAAVRVLERLGIDVEVGPVHESGRAPLSQGMVATATEHARSVAEDYVPAAHSERDIVVIEPSDLAMFRREYERLLPEAEYNTLAEHSYDLLEYVYGLLENGASTDGLTDGDTRCVAYHSHCQQRTLGLETYAIAVLEACNFEVETTDVECCGMAGSFGYKSQYYELAMDVGEVTQKQIEAADAAYTVTSGTSCTEQLDSLLDRRPLHVIELLDPVLKRGR